MKASIIHVFLRIQKPNPESEQSMCIIINVYTKYAISHAEILKYVTKKLSVPQISK